MMPRFICKIQDGETDYWMEWSTVVDAPVTFGMTKDEFLEYYRSEYGRHGLEQAQMLGRFERADKKGTSGHLEDSFDDLISGNRAGKGETQFTKEQIIEWYCRRQDDKNLPYGKRYNPDTDEYEDVTDEVSEEEGDGPKEDGGGHDDGK